MKKKRYSEEQIIGILKENEVGMSVEQLGKGKRKRKGVSPYIVTF